MTLKEQLEEIWNRSGVINHSNINRFNNKHGYCLNNEMSLFVAKGRKVTLIIKYHVKYKKTPTYLAKWYGAAWQMQFEVSES